MAGPGSQDIDNLNGVTFTQSEVGPARATGTGTTYSNGVFNLVGAYHLSDDATFAVSVVTGQPKSGYLQASPDYVASFGEIKVIKTLAGVNTTAYYTVVGFSENGFITGLASPTVDAPGVSPAIPKVQVFANVPVTASTFPLTFNQTDTYVPPPCFAEGTRVLTARGEVAVEDLVEGDEAVTASGERRAVIWIGSRRVKVSAYPVAAEVNPILVRAGAFGEGLPARNLRLSPGHAVHVDGVLVPVGRLVNGATIVQEAVDSVRYFHVELDAHDVLLAEGLPCESYLDDGNREVFANSPEHAALYGRLDPLDRERACAPVVQAGERLAAIQARLHARAEALGWRRSTDGAVRLAVDGAEIAPVHASGQRLWFTVPACAALTLVSSAGRLSELVPGCQDDRRLGVAVSEVRVDGVVLELGSAAFGAGFFGLEGHDGLAWRWTDGQATLTLPAQTLQGMDAGAVLVELALCMIAPAWTRPAAGYLKLVQIG